MCELIENKIFLQFVKENCTDSFVLKITAIIFHEFVLNMIIFLLRVVKIYCP